MKPICVQTLVLLTGSVLLASCTAPSPAAGRPRFTEERSADFIAHYYSDQTSYVLRPVTMEGPYQAICDRARVLKLAQAQPGRELAVMVLTHYSGAASEGPVKLAWLTDLTRLGYRHVVFLRGGDSLQVNGLTVLESPQPAAAFAGK